jgi:SAM-dependent methyltransferase
MNTSALSGNFFHGFADVFDTFYDGKRSPFMQWFDRRFRFDMFERYRLTFERLGDLTDKTVIDIGCGSGPYVCEALRRGAKQILALDPAPRMLELTRERVEKHGFAERVIYYEGYFPSVRPPVTYDFSIVMGVLDYTEHPTAFLRGLRETVTGAAVLSFPSKHWLRTPIRKVRYRLRRCPVWFYDEADIRRHATEAGWQKIDVQKIPGAGMDYHVLLQV